MSTTKQLGKQGPNVSKIGFGLMGLSTSYGAVPSDEESFALLSYAADKGVTFWDTSDVYGPYTNEELLGKWFKKTGRRNEIFLASKFGILLTPNGIEVHGEPEYVKKACNESLARLGVDSIDLYYIHRISKTTPIEKTIEAIVELKNEGKIKYIGLSECSADTVRRAHKIHPITAVEAEFSPWATELQSEQVQLLQTCRELGIGIVAYAPLGRGFGTGTIKSRDDFEDSDFRRYAPRFSEENFPKNLVLLDQLNEIAKSKKITSGQLILAWLTAKDDVIPIPGTKKLKYLEENIGSLGVQLTKEEEEKIDALVDGAEVHGARYPDGVLDDYVFSDSPALKY